MTWKILLIIAVWYFVSETLSWLVCRGAGISDYDTNQVRTLRAAMFAMPPLVPLALLLVLLVRLQRLAGGRGDVSNALFLDGNMDD